MVSVPIWILVVAGAGFAFLALILFLVWTNRFPPADRGGAIINFDSLKAMNQAVEAVCYATGKKPRFVIEGEIDGERLPRYMWPGGEIWHVQGPKVRDLVEGKQVAFAACDINSRGPTSGSRHIVPEYKSPQPEG